jgi:hypothetical protein
MPSIAYKNAKAIATLAALNAQAEHRRRIVAARKSVQRALATAGSEEERQVVLRGVYRSQRAWREEAKYQACLMELEGKSASEIGLELGMTPGAIGNVLSKLRRERTEQIGQMIDAHRAIELERSETIIERFMPLALDEDLFARIERGEPVEAKRVNRALRSALVVMAVMDFRSRLLGLYPGTIRGPRGKGQKAQPK